MYNEARPQDKSDFQPFSRREALRYSILHAVYPEGLPRVINQSTQSDVIPLDDGMMLEGEVDVFPLEVTRGTEGAFVNHYLSYSVYGDATRFVESISISGGDDMRVIASVGTDEVNFTTAEKAETYIRDFGHRYGLRDLE